MRPVYPMRLLRIPDPFDHPDWIFEAILLDDPIDPLILLGHFSGSGRGRAFSSRPPRSAPTRSSAERIDTRIILIDGTELARLMIAYGVGVTPVAVL